MELLGDETRRRMVYLLRARELTISQVAEELKMTPQAIYHHVKKLLKAGMVEVAKEERVENFIEKYYRASAEVFQFSWGSQGKNQARGKQRLRDNLQSLSKVGIPVNVQDNDVVRVFQVQQKMTDLVNRPALEEKVSKLEDVDFVGKQELASLAGMVSMTDKQFQDWVELQKEYRQLLRGLLKPKRDQADSVTS